MRHIIVCFCLLVCLAGCDSHDDQPGIVARVNGDPITLTQVEAAYDLLHLEWSEMSRPSVERLKKEYGAVLSQLIIQKLMEQELERLGTGVSPEDVAGVEQQIRADYPENAFEQVLVEEYISLDTWRNRLKTQLIQEKFVNQILKPNVQLEYKEAEEYYLEHAADFYLPPRVEVAVIRGENRELVGEAAKDLNATSEASSMNASVEKVSVEKLRLRTDLMPPPWHEILDGLQPGQASDVFEEDDEFRCLVLLKRLEGVYLEPAQAYPLIEEILTEKKLGRAFEEWLQNALASARIEVSGHLLPPDMQKEARSREDPS